MNDSQRPVKVKFVQRSSVPGKPLDHIRQTPHNSGMYGVCKFIFDPFEEDYDWLVVIDDLPKILKRNFEKLSCPREHTILVTTEPASITRYGRAFAKQFHYLITNQDADVLPHPRAQRSQTGNVWFYGKDYDEIVAMRPPKKDKLVSTVCSNKRDGHTMHRMRYDFTARLQKEFSSLERFGKGYCWIENKYEALDSYKFHIAIENHIAPHVWTEKLADAFLGYTVPIYCGAPNVYDYFPEESLITIDIRHPDEAIKTIRRVLETPGEYERRLPAVIEARRRVIEEYNLVAMIDKIVRNAPPSSSRSGMKLYNRRMMRARHLPDFFRFAAWKAGNVFKKL
jgi:hypothetical protein